MGLTFLAVVMAILGVYSIMSDLFLRDRSRFSQRVDDQFRKRLRNQAQKSTLFKNLGTPEVVELGADDEPRPDLRRRLEAMVEQSGLNLTPERLMSIAA